MKIAIIYFGCVVFAGCSGLPKIDRVRVKMNKGDSEHALANFKAASQADSQSADAFFWLASYYTNLGDKPEAIRNLNRAIFIDPNKVSAYVLRASAYGSLKQYDKAIEDFSRALMIEPKDYVALVGRAIAHENLDQNDDAISDLEAAIALEPSLKDIEMIDLPLKKVKKMLERIRTKTEPNQSLQTMTTAAVPRQLRSCLI